MSERPHHVVESGPGDAVRGVLDLVDHPEAFGAFTLEWERALKRYGAAILPPLVAAVDHPEPRRRLFAAWLILYFDHLHKGIVDDSAVVAHAEHLLVESLDRDKADDLLWPCAMCTQCPGPPQARRWLRKHLSHDDRRVQCLAAAGLTWYADPGPGVVEHLKNGLTHEEQSQVIAAAAALTRLGQRGVELVPVLVEAVQRAEGIGRLHVLETIKRLGPVAAVAATPIRRLVEDARESSETRAYAAMTLAAVTKGSHAATPLLLQLLSDDDPFLIQGAVLAFLEGDGAPGEAVPRLKDLLNSSNEDVRIAAVRALGAAGLEPGVVIELLLDRVMIEPCAAVAEAVARTLGGLGAPAIDPLLAAVEQEDLRTAAVLVTALATIGAPAVERITQRLSEEASPWTMRLLVGVVREAGSNAGPAVPVMACLLDRAATDELACYLIVALFSSGPAALQAVPALARCVTSRSEEAASWAERTLWNLGPAALPALREVMAAETNANAQHRVGRVLAGMPLPDKAMLSRYEGIPTKDLKVFVFIGKKLVENRELSLRAMEGEPNPDDPQAKPYNFSSLQRATTLVQARLGGQPLLDHIQGRKGGLTEWGRTVLAEAQAVLEMRAAESGRLRG